MTSTPRRLLLLNGPNLNLLGTREPDVYGSMTLDEMMDRVAERGRELGVEVECFQSNDEGALVTRIGAAPGNYDGIVLNPAGYTHTSVALRDALAAVSIPYVEVHLSNIHAREPFRHHSYFSDRAAGVICGLGAYGYMAALEYALSRLREAQH